jgi:hypothetical protein
MLLPCFIGHKIAEEKLFLRFFHDPIGPYLRVNDAACVLIPGKGVGGKRGCSQSNEGVQVSKR